MHFADAPGERQRTLRNTDDVLAPSLMASPGAEWNVEHVSEDGFVRPTHDGLFFIG
jgi:hypothetical protein